MTTKLTCVIIRIVKFNFALSVSRLKLNVNPFLREILKSNFIFPSDQMEVASMAISNFRSQRVKRRMTEHVVPPCERTIPMNQVLVSTKDAELIRKVHRILTAGKNVEIKQDTEGKPKILRVSREIEQ